MWNSLTIQPLWIGRFTHVLRISWVKYLDTLVTKTWYWLLSTGPSMDGSTKITWNFQSYPIILFMWVQCGEQSWTILEHHFDQSHIKFAPFQLNGKYFHDQSNSRSNPSIIELEIFLGKPINYDSLHQYSGKKNLGADRVFHFNASCELPITTGNVWYCTHPHLLETRDLITVGPYHDQVDQYN